MSTMGSSAAQEEARAIAAAQAAGVERRNRPLHLPIAAGVLLAVAMIAMLISWNGYSKARRCSISNVRGPTRSPCRWHA